MKISPVKNSRFTYITTNYTFYFSTLLKLEKFSQRARNLEQRKEMIKQRLKYPRVTIEDEFVIMQIYLETERSGFFVKDNYGNEYENAFEIPLKVGLSYEDNEKTKK